MRQGTEWCMHAWRRSEAACSAARRLESQSPEPRHAFASVSGGQGGQARKATKARHIPLARTLVIFELRADVARRAAGRSAAAPAACRLRGRAGSKRLMAPSPACVHAWKAPSAGRAGVAGGLDPELSSNRGRTNERKEIKAGGLDGCRAAGGTAGVHACFADSRLWPLPCSRQALGVHWVRARLRAQRRAGGRQLVT